MSLDKRTLSFPEKTCMLVRNKWACIFRCSPTRPQPSISYPLISERVPLPSPDALITTAGPAYLTSRQNYLEMPQLQRRRITRPGGGEKSKASGRISPHKRDTTGWNVHNKTETRSKWLLVLLQCIQWKRKADWNKLRKDGWVWEKLQASCFRASGNLWILNQEEFINI